MAVYHTGKAKKKKRRNCNVLKREGGGKTELPLTAVTLDGNVDLVDLANGNNSSSVR